MDEIERVIDIREFSGTLQHLKTEVSKISETLIVLAKQEQKIINLLDRQTRSEQDLYSLRKIVQGPEGLLIKVERNTLKMTMLSTVSSAIIATVLSFVIPLL